MLPLVTQQCFCGSDLALQFILALLWRQTFHVDECLTLEGWPYFVPEGEQAIEREIRLLLLCPRDGSVGSNDRIKLTHTTRGAGVRRVRLRPVSPTRARTGVPAQRAGLRAGWMTRACRGAERARGCLGVRGRRPLNAREQQHKIFITNEVCVCVCGKCA